MEEEIQEDVDSKPKPNRLHFPYVENNVKDIEPNQDLKGVKNASKELKEQRIKGALSSVNRLDAIKHDTANVKSNGDSSFKDMAVSPVKCKVKSPRKSPFKSTTPTNVKISNSPRKSKLNNSPTKSNSSPTKSPKKLKKSEDQKRLKLLDWLTHNPIEEPIDAVDATTHLSTEMQAHLHSTLYEKLGDDFWTDETTSSLAESHDMDSVFGSIERSLKFDFQEQKAALPPLHEKKEPIDYLLAQALLSAKHAGETFEAGKGDEASQAYDAIVDTLLNGPEMANEASQINGFNFSKRAQHSCRVIQVPIVFQSFVRKLLKNCLVSLS